MITAQKLVGNKVVRKSFSETTWSLLGHNKHGWEQITEVIPAMETKNIDEFLGKKKVEVVKPVVAENEINLPVGPGYVQEPEKEKRTYKTKKKK